MTPIRTGREIVADDALDMVPRTFAIEIGDRSA
jgi:hypothetical protein